MKRAWLAKIAKARVECFKCTDSNLPLAGKRRAIQKLPPIVSVCDTYRHPSTAGAYGQKQVSCWYVSKLYRRTTFRLPLTRSMR